jgi:hypothetical protein
LSLRATIRPHSYMHNKSTEWVKCTEWVIRSSKSKTILKIKKKMTNNDLQSIHIKLKIV